MKDPAVAEVSMRFEQLVAFARMRLERRLGVEVKPVLPRAGVDPVARRQTAVAKLARDGTLEGALRVPHAAADMHIVANLRAAHVRCSASVGAPNKARQKTRVRWLIAQLDAAPDDLQIEAVVAWQKTPGQPVSLAKARESPEAVIADKTKDIRSFTLSWTLPAGKKGGAGRGSFADSVLDLVEQFYADVLQPIKPWIEPAPAAPVASHANGADGDQITGELPAEPSPRVRRDPGEPHSHDRAVAALDASDDAIVRETSVEAA